MLWVADDHDDESAAIRDGLLRERYRVVSAGSIADATTTLRDDRIDLVVLSVSLEGASSLPFCRSLRDTVDLPILVAGSAVAGRDIVEAFEAGADGYLARPFREYEVGARIRSLLRRSSAAVARPAVDPPATLEVGAVTLVAASRAITVRGVRSRLPQKEFGLLWLLMIRAGHVVRREVLVREVWGDHKAPSAKTVDVHIGRIREKIEPDPTRPVHLVTIRGVGFRYEAADARGHRAATSLDGFKDGAANPAKDGPPTSGRG